jgi:hypothetical protein
MKCPKCLGDKVKKIVYGMPDFENFDFEKYEVGGCTVMDGQPTHWCTDCEKGFRRKLIVKNINKESSR